MRRLNVILIVVALTAAGIGFLFLPIREWFAQFQGQVAHLGLVGPVLVAAAYVVMTVLLIPGSALTVGAGALFGLWLGGAVVVVGANLGALASFWLARTLWRPRVARWAAARPRFAALDRAIEREGFKMVFFSRLSPAFPFTLLNYLLGLTTVRTGSYVLANLLGMLPGTFLYVYLGATAREALSGGAAGLLRQVLRYVGLVATILVVIIITRLARKALAQAERAAAAAPLQTSESL